MSSIRIRTEVDNGIADVRILIDHPMWTGNQRDLATDTTPPAHYIVEFTVEHNGRAVVVADWGPGVARNPYLQFRLQGVAPGDRLTLLWVDNQGARDQLEATL